MWRGQQIRWPMPRAPFVLGVPHPPGPLEEPAPSFSPTMDSTDEDFPYNPRLRYGPWNDWPERGIPLPPPYQTPWNLEPHGNPHMMPYQPAEPLTPRPNQPDPDLLQYLLETGVLDDRPDLYRAVYRYLQGQGT